MGKARKKPARKTYVLPSWRRKADELFGPTLTAHGKARMEWPLVPIAKALRLEFGGQKAHDIAFHLSDWYADAAFLVALSIYPERFTQKEIREGITQCLIHIPNHVVAAATLGDWPPSDIFNVGVTIKPAPRN